MNQYAINLHAHTFFSDGKGSPLSMALVAKELGFVSLVLTDHYCYGRVPEWLLRETRMGKLFRSACREAREVIPVIRGVELRFGGEEMLVFGSSMLQQIVMHDLNGAELSVELLAKWKKRFPSAFILCHPQDIRNWEALLPILDGYEHHNSGQNMFEYGAVHRDRGCLASLPGWCNSDAHQPLGLYRGHNIVDSKLDNENNLIRYINRRKQPEWVGK